MKEAKPLITQGEGEIFAEILNIMCQGSSTNLLIANYYQLLLTDTERW